MIDEIMEIVLLMWEFFPKKRDPYIHKNLCMMHNNSKKIYECISSGTPFNRLHFEGYCGRVYGSAERIADLVKNDKKAEFYKLLDRLDYLLETIIADEKLGRGDVC